VLTKRLADLAAADIRALIGVAESRHLDFKRPRLWAAWIATVKNFWPMFPQCRRRHTFWCLGGRRSSDGGPRDCTDGPGQEKAQARRPKEELGTGRARRGQYMACSF
jgi:hypothetical protein